ncbi:hypothetical protein BD309DRAFT_68898 [Dichomitus squalens]|nr:hypothetical protein BD309DRAFT_68898 [Dichomitus squalens]
MFVNLNAVMSIIANVPAAIASNIVACRVVRRLTNYTSEGAEVFGTQASTLAFSGLGSCYTTRGIVSISEKEAGKVQLQMDTFQAAPGEVSPSDLETVQYDAAGHFIRMGEDDSTTNVEASPINICPGFVLSLRRSRRFLRIAFS